MHALFFCAILFQYPSRLFYRADLKQYAQFETICYKLNGITKKTATPQPNVHSSQKKYVLREKSNTDAIPFVQLWAKRRKNKRKKKTTTLILNFGLTFIPFTFRAFSETEAFVIKRLNDAAVEHDGGRERGKELSLKAAPTQSQ